MTQLSRPILRTHPNYPGITFAIGADGILFRMRSKRKEYLVTWDDIFGVAGLKALPGNAEILEDAKLAVFKVLNFVPQDKVTL